MTQREVHLSMYTNAIVFILNNCDNCDRERITFPSQPECASCIVLHILYNCTEIALSAILLKEAALTVRRA